MENRTPAVSVIMPVRSPDPTFLAEAVRSVLDQTLTDLELLVIEDPGPDGATAGPTISQFDDPRIRLITNPAPTSLVDQLNQGLQLARSELVARMDADDICAPRRLELQREFLDTHPDVDVVGAQLAIIDESGALIGRRQYPLRHDQIVSAMMRFNPLAHPAVMFRRRVVVEAGGYRYPARAAQDYELWSRLAVAGARFGNRPELLLSYRVHRRSVKATRLRDTVRSTLATKQLHWAGRMSLRARVRMAAERAVLLMPPALVLGLFQLVTFRAPTPDEPEAVRREVGQGARLMLANGTAAALTMAYMAWASRSLGPDQAATFFSAVFTILLLTTLFAPLNTVVTHFTVLYRSRGLEDRARGLRRWMTHRTVAGGAALAGILALGLSAADRLTSVLAWAYLVAWIWILLSIGRGALRGAKDFAALGRSVVVEATLRLGLGIGVLLLWTTPEAALLPYLAAALIGFLLVERLHRGPISRDGVDGRAMTRFAAPMLLLAVADAGYQNWDVVFVSWTFDPAQAGSYGAAAAVTRVLGVLATPFVLLALPLLTERHERRQGTGAALIRLCGYFVALSAGPLLVFWLLGEPLIEILYGPEFIGAAPLLLPHAVSLLLAYLAMMVGQAFAASRRFGFLLVYLLGLAAQIAVLAEAPRSAEEVIDALLVLRVVVLGVMVCLWLWPSRTTGRSS